MTWKPTEPVQIVAGTPPGGGLDRVARALAKAIEAGKLLSVPFEVKNIPGDGARRAWTQGMDLHPGDAHWVAISSANLTTDYLVGGSSFEHRRFTPIATLVTEYIAFAVRTDSTIRSGQDLLTRLGQAPQSVTVALSTALGNPNHIALARLTRQAGGDVNAPVIRVFDTAVDAVADVVAGNADVTSVTAASVTADVEAGRLRVIGLTAPKRLGGAFANAPTWAEQNADCVIGAWRGLTGATGITPDQVAFWSSVLREAVKQPVWSRELERMSQSPMYQDGAELKTHLTNERANFVSILDQLGLLKVKP